MALKDVFDDMSEDLKSQLQECKTPEEMFALASEEGVELTDEQLEVVSGGWGDCSDQCHMDACPDFT